MASKRASEALASLLYFMICYFGKLAYLSMPKFLAGCHYNEEEISWHLKKI
jgi:hypothetical protein